MSASLSACIITSHDVYNSRASLQAYALRTYLLKIGVHALPINYKPDYLSRNFILWDYYSAKLNKPFIRTLYSLVKLPGKIIYRHVTCKKQYDAFTAEYLKLPSKRFSFCEGLKLSPPIADIYIASREKIWNTALPNSKDSAIYLTFALDKAVKADYVASFAEERIEDAYEQNVKSWLHDSNFILNSSLPIIIFAYFIFNIVHRDTIYKLQNNSAFWALMMYTSFSNRFAQLAWFIMPIVCIYPWMKQTFWHMGQSKRLGNYILISYAYTFFSHFILFL